MNYCRRCESDYEKPGTCNCFAEGGDAKPAETKPAPTIPGGFLPAPVYPYPVYPWWGGGWWGTCPPPAYLPAVSVPFVQTLEFIGDDPSATTTDGHETYWAHNWTVRAHDVNASGSWTSLR